MSKKIFGDPQKIDLGTSSFRKMMESDNLYVDKTKFIEDFLNESNTVQLVLRQRRLGKSLNLDTLKCFLTDKTDNRSFFKGMYIESSPVWGKANSTPVFHFNFKDFTMENFKHSLYMDVLSNIEENFGLDSLTGYAKILVDEFMENKSKIETGLRFITKLAHVVSGKRSVIIIDEYDKLLAENYNSHLYHEVRGFITNVLSSGLKDNEYLEKAILTGVTRVSRESILSGLNNLQVFDMFSDNVYTDDFGLTEEEIDGLNGLFHFNKPEVKNWYNGIKVSGHPIYNIYAVMSYLKYGKLDNYWGQSGTIEIITEHLNEERITAITSLLSGDVFSTHINRRISFRQLTSEPSDSMFYSLLIQAGYLSLEKLEEGDIAYVSIPNIELMNVWKNFILTSVIKRVNVVRTIFDNVHDLELFCRDLEYLLSDRLSYHDIGSYGDRTPEKVYHIFVLGVLSAYSDVRYKKFPASNRESGDGRYDILIEREDFSIVFEFKAVSEEAQMNEKADEALKQIDNKRYFADANDTKPLIKTAIVFCGKKCFAKAVLHQW